MYIIINANIIITVRLRNMSFYNNKLLKKRNNIIITIFRKKRKRAIRKWMLFAKHKIKMQLLKRRFHLRSLFGLWTNHYNTNNNIKYIRYLGYRRILSLMMQYWKKYTLLQIREKITIHYVQRLERKRVTLIYLQNWVRQHDANKKTKLELYIRSRTQRRLLRKQFKIWNLVILQRKIQHFKILNKVYHGWVRYVSMRYRKKQITVSATRHHQVVNFFKYYYIWSSSTKSTKTSSRKTNLAKTHFRINNIREALRVLRFKTKRSTRLKVMKRVGFYDSIGLKLGLRVYTKALFCKIDAATTYTTIDNWININKLHKAILALRTLPRLNKRRQQKKILLAWKKASKTNKIKRAAMTDRLTTIGKKIRLSACFNTIVGYSKSHKLNRTVIFYVTMMKKNNIFKTWQKKAKSNRIAINSIQKWNLYHIINHYRYYFRLWRAIVGPIMRVTSSVILTYAFEKMKNEFRTRKLMTIAIGHDHKKGIKRTFFAWKGFIIKKHVLLKTLMREQKNSIKDSRKSFTASATNGNVIDDSPMMREQKNSIRGTKSYIANTTNSGNVIGANSLAREQTSIRGTKSYIANTTTTPNPSSINDYEINHNSVDNSGNFVDNDPLMRDQSFNRSRKSNAAITTNTDADTSNDVVNNYSVDYSSKVIDDDLLMTEQKDSIKGNRKSYIANTNSGNVIDVNRLAREQTSIRSTKLSSATSANVTDDNPINDYEVNHNFDDNSGNDVDDDHLMRDQSFNRSSRKFDASNDVVTINRNRNTNADTSNDDVNNYSVTNYSVDNSNVIDYDHTSEDNEYVNDDVVIMTPSYYTNANANTNNNATTNTNTNASTNTNTNTNSVSIATSTKRRHNTYINTSIHINSNFDFKHRDKADINTSIMMSEVILYY